MTGTYAPLLLEGNIADCVVEGDIPADIDGSYYRNGPNPQYPPRGPYANWYDGDGMLHLMSFQNGRCEYRNRFIRTKAFQEEQAAGRALYAGLIDKPSLARGVTDAYDTIQRSEEHTV